jgi:ubiquinone/menaquinone biosynthesis C-methylase UbiE
MLGAEVTGVDFSDEAIIEARRLNNEIGLDSEFIISDVYSLPKLLHKKYDIVYTSYGVLTWLPDLSKWAKIINHFLKNEGYFYMAEIHPASMMFENEGEVKKLNVKYPYFSKPSPLEFEDEGSYADPKANTENNKTYEWIYSLTDVFTSLLNAGLKIVFFREYPYTVYPQFPFMKRGEDGYWRMEEEIPLLFSIKAVKDRS